MKQMSQDERDFLLWRYYHHDLTPQELLLVQEQLASNLEWQKAFQEIQSGEQQLSLLETEMPPLRFSKNVMDAIAEAPIAQATKSYINTKLIKAIGFGFIAIIVVFIVYAVTQVNWTNSSVKTDEIPVHIPNISVNWNFANGSSWLYGCFAIVIVCAFVLADKFLLSKKHYNISEK